MKIIGIGLNKTGTTTLGVCMEQIGKRHLSFNAPAFDHILNDDLEALWEITDAYESFEDWPWPLVYKKMDDRYPHSKFILTTRKSPEVWFQSLCKHSERSENKNSPFRKKIYGFDMPHENKDHHLSFYEQHTAKARSYFKDRPNDFLEVCWERGDNWLQLANFLNIPVPKSPFPHAGKAVGTTGQLLRKIKSHVAHAIGRK